MKRKFNKEDVMYRSAEFNIYWVMNEGYYIGNKLTGKCTFFDPRLYSYWDVYVHALNTIISPT